MKIKLIIASVLALATTIAIDSINNLSYTYTTGAPASNTGSIGDGQTCSRSGCHSGNVPTVSGWITHDIEANGYTPNATYNITVTATENGFNKFGFEITSEDAAGSKMGTFTITNSSETQLASGNDNFVTHKIAGTAGTGQKSWSFEWNAPNSGMGDVTFCVACAAADGANGPAGDNIYMECLTIQENTINPGIFENQLNQLNVQTFPNPVTENLQLHYSIEEKEIVTAEIYSIDGKLVQHLFTQTELAGSYQKTFNLSGLNETLQAKQVAKHGIYFLKLAAGNKITTSKLVVLQ